MDQSFEQRTAVRQNIIRAIVANLKVASLIIIFTCGVAWAMGDFNLQMATNVVIGWVILALVVGFSRGIKGKL